MNNDVFISISLNNNNVIISPSTDIYEVIIDLRKNRKWI